MKLGLCTIAFREYTIPTVLSAALGAQVEGIELWARPGHLPVRFNPAFCQDLNRQLRQQHLRLVVLGSYLRAGSSQFTSDLQAVLQWAEGLEPGLVRVWAGETGAEQATPGERGGVVEHLRQLCQAAPGCRFVMERHENTLTDHIESLQRLLEQVDCANLGVNYQVVSWEDTAAAVAGIHTLSERIWNVHVQNYGTDAGGQRVPWEIRTGEIDYRAVLSALRETGYDGFLEIEFLRRGPNSQLSLHERRQTLMSETEHLGRLVVEL